MNGIPITVVGNLTADPELRYTQDGIPLANLTIASTERVYDRDSGQWVDGDATFLRTTAWRQLAEHAAASLAKGMQVVATGKLKQRTYQDPNSGENRTVMELELEDLAVSLRWGTAQFTKSAARGQNASHAAPVAEEAPAVSAPAQRPAARQSAPRQAVARPAARQQAAKPAAAQRELVSAAQASDDDLF